MTGTIILCLRDGQHGKYRDHPKRTEDTWTYLNIQYWYQRSEDIAITLPSQTLTHRKKKQWLHQQVLGALPGLVQVASTGPHLTAVGLPGPSGLQQPRLRGRPLGVRNLRRRPRSTASLGLGRPCSSGFSGANAQFRQAESALTRHAKFDNKSLHFSGAELLGSVYILPQWGRGWYYWKAKFLHLLPGLQLYIHDTWSHLRLRWNRIPPPSNMKFIRSCVLWCHCVEQHPPGA